MWAALCPLHPRSRFGAGVSSFFPHTSGRPLARGTNVALPPNYDLSWQGRGACIDADPELFYHPENERGDARALRDFVAKTVCARCPVTRECADFAEVTRDTHGVLGGKSVEERGFNSILGKGPRKSIAA